MKAVIIVMLLAIAYGAQASVLPIGLVNPLGQSLTVSQPILATPFGHIGSASVIQANPGVWGAPTIIAAGHPAATIIG